MKENELETIEGNKPKKFGKAFWISFLISFLSISALGGLIAITVGYSLYNGAFSTHVYPILVDAFGLAGVLGLLVFLLGFVAAKGSFDMLAYSVGLVLNVTFRHKSWKESFPATFADYKAKKDADERKPILAILFVSLIFIAVALFLLIPLTSSR